MKTVTNVRKDTASRNASPCRTEGMKQVPVFCQLDCFDLGNLNMKHINAQKLAAYGLIVLRHLVDECRLWGLLEEAAAAA